MENGTCDVLLVEDSYDDAYFMNRAWGKGASPYALAHVSNGEKAKDFLLGGGNYAARKGLPLPRCIISDLKMPLCDGIQLAQWVRQQPELTSIPFVVLSSSPQETDVAAAHESGATAYFVKPKALSGYFELIEELSVYWNEESLHR